MQVYDPYAVVAFNLSRDYILSQSTPPINPGDTLSESTTKSTYSLHWNEIYLWDNFRDSVGNYWNNVVSQADKQCDVFTQHTYSNAVQTLATDMRVTNEGNIKVCIDNVEVEKIMVVEEAQIAIYKVTALRRVYPKPYEDAIP
jgi:hypothetical protein